MSENERHPFLSGLSKHRGSPPTILVIFGASGDLTARKLLPAIYNLALDSLLPPQFHLIGFGRSKIENDAFRDQTEKDLKEFSRRNVDESIWEGMRENLTYLAGGYDDPNSFKELAKQIEGIEKEAGREMQVIFYISTPPGVFKPIVQNLGECGLAHRRINGQWSSKVIIEKPFGHDLESAKDLNLAIREHFAEEQIFRIDHYLGKETVQNLLVLRFANAIFEPIWNRTYVDHVAITVAEDIGVGSRAGYYDRSGALRDMIQNHTMQLLSLVAMEAASSLNPEAIRNEKVKVLQAIQPLCLSEQSCDVVRARYAPGIVNGERVKGYADEEDVPDTSNTETYAALRLFINNWRWQGVPFYLRSGKRMTRRLSEVAIHFKQPPGVLFSKDSSLNLAQNTLVIQVQPDEGMVLLMNSKIPGLETRIQPVKMHFRYATTFGSNTPEAYERLILDAMVGDSTLFIRGDETEASWRLISPILQRWEEMGKEGLHEYPAGTWGPEAAEQLVAQDGNEWRRA